MTIDLVPEPDGAIWVFGYGSLMWRPEFPTVASEPGLLRGYHRRLCILSRRHRGTPARPGVVMGLDRGGACKGRALKVAAADARSTVDYLWDREMVDYPYRPRWLPVRIPGGTVTALTFVVDRHRASEYTGVLAPEAVAGLVAQGRGDRGTALEYLENTVTHLDELGIAEGPLHRILALARQRTGSDR